MKRREGIECTHPVPKQLPNPLLRGRSHVRFVFGAPQRRASRAGTAVPGASRQGVWHSRLHLFVQY
jgi:hypothetical protein